MADSLDDHDHGNGPGVSGQQVQAQPGVVQQAQDQAASGLGDSVADLVLVFNLRVPKAWILCWALCKAVDMDQNLICPTRTSSLQKEEQKQENR